MGTDKQTETNVPKTLGKADYDILTKASKDWKSFDKTAKGMRVKLYSIGKGLNLLYITLKAKGVKRDEIARLANVYFPNMDKQFRSDVRKVANLMPEIETWAVKHYAKGYNPNGLLIHFARFQKQMDKVYKHFATVQYQSDLFGNPQNIGYDMESDQFFFTDLTIPTGKKSIITDKGLEVVEQTLKHDIEAQNPSKVTVQDFKGITDKYFNNALILFNADKFSASDKDMEVLLYIHERLEHFKAHTADTVKMEILKTEKKLKVA